MKELTIEQKAKAYDEAIEKARKVYNNISPENSSVKKILEKAFPELKESEDKDEKIRQALIKLVTNHASMDLFIEYDIHLDEAIAWLEKQGENILIEEIKRRKELYSQEKEKAVSSTEKLSLGGRIAMLEELLAFIDVKQGEQKPADKVEPKFHEGEWITCDELNTAKIINIDGNRYVAEFIDGNKCFPRIDFVDRLFHLWTIQDAKDGDVLATIKGGVFIYAKVLYNKPYAYCGVDKYGVFKDNCLNNNWTNSVDNIHPATKEQRDTLMKAMADAGWEFDFEKKELKKIELNPDDLIEESYQQQADDLIDMVTEKLAWSEEDELNLNQAIYVCHQNGYDGVENWLKSLKDKLQLKPKQEWSEEDENRFSNLIFLVKCSGENEATKKGFIDFINRLKFIRPQKFAVWSKEDEENFRDIMGAIHAVSYQTSKDEEARIDWLRTLKQRMVG